ncbi:MAG: energy-coupled thiamine transporter ThiT [Lachnospiraceae bacterium]|nr:energy-coupled thiamine transporter ThiT [Lachnospiraceae bacterium]
MVIAFLRYDREGAGGEDAGNEGAGRRGADGKTADGTPSAFTPGQLVFSAVSLALAFALSFVKIFHMPWGGSVTLCSMFFVVIIGYWYGPKIGLTAAFAYGLLQFVQGGGGYILTLMQVAFDYVLAFAALGVSGFFYKKKNGLLIGYIVAILLRGAFHAAGGYLYWMEYMPEEFPKQLSAIYPIVYNYSFILLEGVLTVIILLLPPVSRAIAYVTRMARGKN